MKYLILLILAAFSCGSPQKNEEGKNKDTALQGGRIETVKGLTVTIPEGWEVQYNYEGTDLMVMSPTDMMDKFRENFNVIVAGEVDVSLEDYYAQNLEYFRSSVSDFKLLDKGKEKIDGADARWIDYKFNYSDRTIYGTQYYVIRNNKAFVITYSGAGASDDPYKTTFTNALKTVKLK